MKSSLLPKLCCPSCKGNLELTTARTETVEDPGKPSFTEILEGTLSCPGCAKEFPVTGGIPRFVPSDDYVRSFSLQWRKLRSRRRAPLVDSTEREFRTRTDIDPATLKGKWVLEGGCGAGRFLRFLSDFEAEVVGVDLSFGVEGAYQLAGRRRNVHIVQASLFELPFRESGFDCIYSLGVLHHTPSTRRAFSVLPPLLKPGGRIAIWVYSGHNLVSWKFGDYYRKVTTRLPPRVLYYLCHAAIPLHYVYKVPVVGRLAQIVLRTDGGHPDPRFRVLNTFDYYAPKYQFRHTYGEVFGWFEESGLEKIRVLSVPVAVAGSRPAAPEPAGAAARPTVDSN